MAAAPGPTTRSRPLGKRQEVDGVPPPRFLGLAARLQLLQAELADRLQHRVARLGPPALHLVQQALGDERGHTIEDVSASSCPALADRLRRLKREAAREDGEPPEERLLLGREQIVDQAMASRIVRSAPADRRSTARQQRAAAAPTGPAARPAAGLVTRAAASSMARGNPSRRRQMAETAAAFSAVEREVGATRPRPLDEERDRGTRSPTPPARQVVRVRQG